MKSKDLSLEQVDSIIEFFSNGDHSKVLKHIKDLHEDYPNNAFLLNIEGLCYSSTGEFDRAISSFKESISLKTKNLDAMYNLGNTYREVNQHGNAIDLYKEIIEILPEHIGALHNLGVTLQELGKLNEAIDHYEQAKILHPDNSDIRVNLGYIFQSKGQFNEAIEEYEIALKIDSNNEVIINNLGACLRELGFIDEAIENFKKSLKINPEYAEAHFNLGYAYQDLGKINLAISEYERAISINNHAMSYHSISHLKNFAVDDNLIPKMQAILQSNELSPSERIHICRALSNIFEKLGLKTEFYKYLDESNKLQKRKLNYSLDKTKNEFISIKKLFEETQPQAKKSSASPPLNIRPIFILGMPRSGTSLVEQIISSHYKVYGAGELYTLSKLISPVIDNFISGDIIQLNETSNRFIRNQYLEMLSSFNTQENIITDKLPLNFQYIGFILSAIPEAKIIHVKRDAKATCWSNYKYYFESKKNGYSNDFVDLAGFYKLYLDLMSYWHELFPSKIYDLCYEDLTTNQAEETRKLLDYCDLDWDENCLYFYDNDRPVKTISALQVRKKMYQGSSDAWKEHWAHIQPLINALDCD